MDEMSDHGRDYKEHKKAQKAKRAAPEAAKIEEAREVGDVGDAGEAPPQKPEKTAEIDLPTKSEKPKRTRRRKKSKKAGEALPQKPEEAAKVDLPTKSEGPKKTKRRKKSKKAAKQPERRRCWDWIVSSGNVHYAKNRSSFKSYRHISLVVQTKNGTIRIIGIGKVVLKAKLLESDEISELVLKNVLHVPDALCNGFSPSLLENDYIRCENAAVGSDKGGVAMWHAAEFCGLSRLVLEGDPQGESLLTEAEQESKLGFNLSLSLDEKETLRLPHLPHRPKSSTIAKDNLESPTLSTEAAIAKEERPIEDLLRRRTDSDDEWVIDDYDSDGSEQEGTKVGHPYFAKWLQEMTAESLANTSKFACSPEVLLNATAKGIHAVTEIYKSAKPDLLRVGNSEEKLTKEAFKAAFDSEMYRTLNLSLPAK